jgi:opacity protein-like surface antigen
MDSRMRYASSASEPGPAGELFSGRCDYKYPAWESREARARIHALSTVAGRLGYASERTLVYAKAGGAAANESYNLNLVGGPQPAGLGFGIANTSRTRWGWTIGGGVEHAIGFNWTTKLEYNYMDFGSAAVPFAFPPPFNSFSITDRVHIVKLGLNYKLGWYPVIVK